MQAYIFSGQEEKKNVYRPVSAHVCDSFSRSKSSPKKINRILYQKTQKQCTAFFGAASKTIKDKHKPSGIPQSLKMTSTEKIATIAAIPLVSS